MTDKLQEHPLSFIPTHTRNQTRLQTKFHSPNNETQLVPHTFTTGQSELKVVHRPPAVLLGELSHKAVKVLVLRGLENDDGSLVLRETIDDIGELFTSLKLLELFETFLGLRDKELISCLRSWGWIVQGMGLLYNDIQVEHRRTAHDAN